MRISKAVLVFIALTGSHTKSGCHTPFLRNASNPLAARNRSFSQKAVIQTNLIQTSFVTLRKIEYTII